MTNEKLAKYENIQPSSPLTMTLGSGRVFVGSRKWIKYSTGSRKLQKSSLIQDSGISSDSGIAEYNILDAGFCFLIVETT